jgi:hypothetical protein
LAVLFLLAGCASPISGSAGPSTTPLATAPPATADRLVGVVAIGNSGLTGYGTDPVAYRALDNSWATGTNPLVHSIYQRLVAIEPSIASHVTNTAIPGSKAGDLTDEAIEAMSAVPHPQLVIVQVVGNDIACDGSDPANYPRFGQFVRAALDTIVAASPRTRILVLSDLGTPAGRAAVLSTDPAARANSSGAGMCDLFDATGTIQPANISRLTTITQGYEGSLTATCAQVPQCVYDDGAMSKFDFQVSDFLVDAGNHLTVSGQARLAELMWPTVTRALATGR